MASRILPSISRAVMRNTRMRNGVRVIGQPIGAQYGFAGQVRSFGITASKDEATGSIPDAHRSNSEELISKVEPIVVQSEVALCDGGGGALGHPLEYIQVTADKPSICKYCGLRYILDHHH